MNVSIIFLMVAIAMGGVVWVFGYPLLSGERKTEQRMASVARNRADAAANRAVRPKVAT